MALPDSRSRPPVTSTDLVDAGSHAQLLHTSAVAGRDVSLPVFNDAIERGLRTAQLDDMLSLWYESHWFPPASLHQLEEEVLL